MTDDTPDPPTREDVLAMLGDAINEAHRKVENGRVYDAEAEQVRQGWIRALAYAANQYRQLRKDRELEELQARVEALEGGRPAEPTLAEVAE